MSAVLHPSNLDQLLEAVRGTPQVIPFGGGTKPALFQTRAVPISTCCLNGLVEYEPSEFTFTALAGTPIRTIARTLHDSGQYLPFDPMLSEAGATLGGTVASGLSGPGRFRFGGLRDFILGIRFIDGAGRLLRMGGKVVKNAAGFDLPKFFVGSLGRWGILTEITFKVFPRPQASRTIALTVSGIEAAIRRLQELSVNRWELQALDVPPGGHQVVLRVAGPDAALAPITREILARWPGEEWSPTDADRFWSDVSEFRWAHPDGRLVKIPVTPDAMAGLDHAATATADVRIHYSAGGNVAYVSMPPGPVPEGFETALRDQRLAGLTLRGDGPLWWGARYRPGVEQALKSALDPENRFPSMDD